MALTIGPRSQGSDFYHLRGTRSNEVLDRLVHGLFKFLESLKIEVSITDGKQSCEKKELALRCSLGSVSFRTVRFIGEHILSTTLDLGEDCCFGSNLARRPEFRVNNVCDKLGLLHCHHGLAVINSPHPLMRDMHHHRKSEYDGSASLAYLRLALATNNICRDQTSDELRVHTGVSVKYC